MFSTVAQNAVARALKPETYNLVERHSLSRGGLVASFKPKSQKTHSRFTPSVVSTLNTRDVYNSPRAVGKAPGSGGGVLDRPTVSPGRDSEFDLSKSRKKKRPPQYRVLLHNDNFNKREYVVQVLLKVIPGMSVDIAVNVMQEAHLHGKATCITAPQEDAEDYCEGLRSNGLVSSIEPASDKE